MVLGEVRSRYQASMVGKQMDTVIRIVSSHDLGKTGESREQLVHKRPYIYQTKVLKERHWWK